MNALATSRVHVGGAGMAAKAKLATNLVLGLNRAALAEGMVFAQTLGIQPETFLQLVLNTPARSDAAVIKGEMMVKENLGYLVLDNSYLALIPGVAIMILVMSFNLMSMGLRDALDPYNQK